MISERIIKKYEAALDDYLDSVARRHRYNDRFTFALRAAYPGPWQAEGARFAQWMDAVNYQAFQMIDHVSSGSIQPLSVDEFIASLDAFEDA